MSETKPNPGPWKAFGLEVGQSRRNLICTLYQQSGNSVSMGVETTKANARLIAAAPDLLAALELLHELAPHADWCPTMKGGYACACPLHEAGKAIAKAKGNQ